MTTTRNTAPVGHDLRQARHRAGITRAQLASLVGCSLAQLANIEQGAVPRRSRVVDEALVALARLADDGGSAA